jgi:general L-amino acid transport system permease protein
MTLVPELLAVWLALSLYTAAFIAEIVRAGILAVSKGQTEAASALGIRPNHTLRLVVIPQAMRVIIPPLTSQYLNITKNSSLAVAIAYPELVSVFAGTCIEPSWQRNRNDFHDDDGLPNCFINHSCFYELVQ